MASRNKSVPLKKFKRVASKALRMEREKSQHDLQTTNAPTKVNNVVPSSQSQSKSCTPQEQHTLPPQSPKRTTAKVAHPNLRPSSLPPCVRKDITLVASNKMAANKAASSKENWQQNANELPDKKALLGEKAHSEEESVQSPRPQIEPTNKRRSLDDLIYLRRVKEDIVCQRRSKDDEFLHRRQVKLLHDNAHQHVRVATAAAVAAASTVVAQMRKDAIDAVARQQAPYMRMAAMSSAKANSSNFSTPNDQRRVIRNSNLLSSALSIIREMDPAFLETLCYAIHDQVTKDDKSESD